MFLQPRFEPAFEARGELRLRDEELRIFHAHPAELIGRESAAGHEEVDMRMVAQVARPGLQHGGETEFRAEVFGVGGQVLQRARAFFQQRAIPAPRRRADRLAQLFRHSQRDEEVGHGQQPRTLLREPRGRVVAPAARTGAMIAGVMGEVLLPATAAVVLSAQRRRAAAPDGAHGGALLIGDRRPEARHVVRPVRGEKVGQPDHVTARCNTSSAARVRASLSGVRCV